MVNYDGFYASLEIMWKGMLGLFLVAIFIMALTMALKFFMRKLRNEGKHCRSGGEHSESPLLK
jgi:hypothetical protein